MAWNLNDTIDQNNNQGQQPRSSAAPPPVVQPDSNAPGPDAYDPSWRPSGNAFLDFLTRPRAKTENVGEALKDYGLAGLDDVTMGLGTHLAGLDREAEQAQQNLGIMRYPTAALTYAVGPGAAYKAGMEALGGKALTRGILGATTEGALGGATSAAGHGGSLEDVLTGAGTGGAMGVGLSTLATAAAPAVRAGASKLGPTSADDLTRSLLADKQAKFNDFDRIQYDPSQIKNAVDNVHSQVYAGDDGTFLRDTSEVNRILRNYSNDMDVAALLGNRANAGGYQQTMVKLNKIVADGGAPGRAAKDARDGLMQAFPTLQPANATPAEAVGRLAAANAAHAAHANSEQLGDWLSTIDTYPAKTMVPGTEASAALENTPQFYRGPGQSEALTNIGRAGTGGIEGIAGQTAPFALGAAGYKLGGETGAGLGFGLGVGMRAVQPIAQRAAVRRAIFDAYPALSGRQPSNPEETVGNLLRTLVGGKLAADRQPKPTDWIPPGTGGFVMPYMNY
jgi:hypothetical protein